MPILDKANNLLTPVNAIIFAALVVFGALGARLARFGVFTLVIRSLWLPWAPLGTPLALVLLIIFVAIPWYREHQFVRQLGSGYRVAGQQSPQELQAKFSAGVREYRALPQHAGKGDATYVLP